MENVQNAPNRVQMARFGPIIAHNHSHGLCGASGTPPEPPNPPKIKKNRRLSGGQGPLFTLLALKGWGQKFNNPMQRLHSRDMHGHTVETCMATQQRPAWQHRPGPGPGTKDKGPMHVSHGQGPRTRSQGPGPLVFYSLSHSASKSSLLLKSSMTKA